MEGNSSDRLRHRRSLLESLDVQRAALLDSAQSGTFTTQQRRAVELLTSPDVRKAFDLKQEPDDVKDRYGRNIHGQCVLLARRPEDKAMAGLWEFPGGKVNEGETPEAALVAVAGTGEKVDLLLTDVVLPGMNGKKLAGELRGLCPGLKVMFLPITGNGEHLQPPAQTTGSNLFPEAVSGSSTPPVVVLIWVFCKPHEITVVLLFRRLWLFRFSINHPPTNYCWMPDISGITTNQPFLMIPPCIQPPVKTEKIPESGLTALVMLPKKTISLTSMDITVEMESE